MNCILIERDVKQYDDFDKETCVYRTVKTIHEQHVVDLDQAAFTCNSQIGRTLYSPEKPQRLIRGIVLPTAVLFNRFKDHEPLRDLFEDDEVPIDSLSEPQQQMIYGMFDEQRLYGVWKYIVCPSTSADSSVFWRYDDMAFQKTIEALRRFYFSKDIPLMLCSWTPFRRVCIERNGKRRFVDKKPEKTPVLVQPKAFIGISSRCQACTRYGYANFRDREHHFSNGYSSMICEKLRGFSE